MTMVCGDMFKGNNTYICSMTLETNSHMIWNNTSLLSIALTQQVQNTAGKKTETRRKVTNLGGILAWASLARNIRLQKCTENCRTTEDIVYILNILVSGLSLDSVFSGCNICM